MPIFVLASLLATHNNFKKCVNKVSSNSSQFMTAAVYEEEKNLIDG